MIRENANLRNENLLLGKKVVCFEEENLQLVKRKARLEDCLGEGMETIKKFKNSRQEMIGEIGHIN